MGNQSRAAREVFDAEVQPLQKLWTPARVYPSVSNLPYLLP
jgi:hypothetical protein